MSKGKFAQIETSFLLNDSRMDELTATEFRLYVTLWILAVDQRTERSLKMIFTGIIYASLILAGVITIICKGGIDGEERLNEIFGTDCQGQSPERRRTNREGV